MGLKGHSDQAAVLIKDDYTINTVDLLRHQHSQPYYVVPNPIRSPFTIPVGVEYVVSGDLLVLSTLTISAGATLIVYGAVTNKEGTIDIKETGNLEIYEFLAGQSTKSVREIPAVPVGLAVPGPSSLRNRSIAYRVTDSKSQPA